MIPEWKIYPRSQGHSTVYLQNVVTDPAIQVGALPAAPKFSSSRATLQAVLPR